MSDIILRKCGACTELIEIDKNHTSNVVFYKKKYYHSKCFCDLATKRSQSKSKSATEWKEAFDNIWMLEAETKKMLENALVKNELNDWLLTHYDIAIVPSRFWQVAADLELGVYKGKKCKPVFMELLLGAWKWGQRKLDKINTNNKLNCRGPKTDTERINYDLSIIIAHIVDYEKFIARTKADEAAKQSNKEITRINYNSLSNRHIEKNDGFDDISNLIDEFF